jgi:hypothetical protein
MRHATIRFRAHEPDYSDLPNVKHKWDASVYGDVEEELPYKAPPPLGKQVILTHYVDANLYHNVLTGRSVTGVLHFLNGTPIDWYSKKQATVESATYGSEFVAARTCVEQIIDLRHTLRYLGVPVIEMSQMFGDNKTMVDSATKIHAKRDSALSVHCVRKAMAAGFSLALIISLVLAIQLMCWLSIGRTRAYGLCYNLYYYATTFNILAR